MSAAERIPRSILVVDDDEPFRRRLARALAARCHEVRQAADGEEALRLCAEDPPELAVVDLRLPEMDGLEVVRRMLEMEPSIRIVVLTGYGSIATALKSVRMGAVNYLSKLACPHEILQAFEPGGDGGVPDGEANEAPAPSLARVEWEHIQRILTDCDGNISLAARRLGIHRRSLQRKLTRPPARSRP